MPVAIVTKYLGPTNYRGSRIVASVPSRIADYDYQNANDPDRSPETRELYRAGHWRLTVPYSYELSGESVHRVAAQALADRLGWTGELIAGALPDGYAFVFTGRPNLCATCGAADENHEPLPDSPAADGHRFKRA